VSHEELVVAGWEWVLERVDEADAAGAEGEIETYRSGSVHGAARATDGARATPTRRDEKARQPAFAPWCALTPEADRAAREVLALPLRADAIDRIVDVFRRR
jgi:hypothetical protein